MNMATIDFIIDGDLLTVTVTGELTAEDVISAVNEHYSTGTVKDVIWVLTEGLMQLISRDDFKSIARATKAAVANGTRQNGKTAYVTNIDSEYGLARMYSVIAELEGISDIEYHVFKTLEEARHWTKHC